MSVTKKKNASVQPRHVRRELPKHLWETFEWKRIEELEQKVERLMGTSADQQAVVDKVAADVVTVSAKVGSLTSQVADLTAQVAALQAAPPVLDQAQLDANVASLNDSASKLEAL